MWQNRTSMHRARFYRALEEVRDMPRPTVRIQGATAEPNREAS